jgi:cation diffusion facilitator CzcD-associated flavoprotein CzcO
MTAVRPLTIVFAAAMPASLEPAPIAGTHVYHPGSVNVEHLDVLIVGAGLSGIGAAHHLQERCPGKTYALLESRDAIGGTWDLFRYPGIRSDSDMHTLGFSFRPWTEAKAIADGPSILRYVEATERDGGIDRHVRFHHRVVRADWSTDEARWHVEAERSDTGQTVQLTCGFLLLCTGYYRYDEGYTPEFEGVERFEGPVIHPQRWPEDFDYTGKRVVVIGSGATAVTLVPSLAQRAEHVTMLQRSPTYIVSLPAEDPIANGLRRRLSPKRAYSIVRWKNVLSQMAIFQLSRRRPDVVKKMLRRGVARQLPAGYDVATHFTPRYDPWDQRMCLVPDGDLFAAIRDGRASIATDTIDTFTERGIRLTSGTELEADAIVTATGLNLLALGGTELAVDGEDVEIPKALTYRGMMLSDVPNFGFVAGYTNASWTLKADLTSEYVCRLLNHMDANGHRQCMPHNDDPDVSDQPFIDFSSGYVMRAIAEFPRQGSKAPWRLRQNYALDIGTLRYAPIDDGAMRFSSPAPARPRVGAA